MSRQGSDLAEDGLGFVEDSELTKHGRAIVVDLFSGEAVFGVEGVNAAERELDATSGGGKTTPGALVGAADDISV